MGSQSVSDAAGGSTTEPKIPTSRSDDGRERWQDSGTSRPCRNSPPLTPQSTTISIRTDISTVATFSNRTAQLPWPSGGCWPPEDTPCPALSSLVRIKLTPPPPVSPTATLWQREPTSTPTRNCKGWGFDIDRSFSKRNPRIILRSRLPAEPRSPAIGTIPVDPSDDAGDGGGISKGVSPASRTTDPNSHTPASDKLDAVHRTRHLQRRENRRRRNGYVDNSRTRVLAHTHCATTAANSSRNSMVDPKQLSCAELKRSCVDGSHVARII